MSLSPLQIEYHRGYIEGVKHFGWMCFCSVGAGAIIGWCFRRILYACQ